MLSAERVSKWHWSPFAVSTPISPNSDTHYRGSHPVTEHPSRNNAYSRVYRGSTKSLYELLYSVDSCSRYSPFPSGLYSVTYSGPNYRCSGDSMGSTMAPL